jgi:hypothetical protein
MAVKPIPGGPFFFTLVWCCPKKMQSDADNDLVCRRHLFQSAADLKHIQRVLSTTTWHVTTEKMTWILQSTREQPV